MKVVGMIPARLESSRLPEKALIDICGLPMVVHTYKRSRYAKKLDDLYVVTDSDKIRQTVEQHGGKALMTGRHHKTGSDRLAEACKYIDCDIVVNIQGDEPLVDPDHIDAIVTPLIEDPTLQISVGVTRYNKKNSPSDIKAVLDLEGNILYCSRTDLPSDARTPVHDMLKMCFIVPFRKDFLLQYASWQPTPLESIEFNEYLRVLEHGVRIRGVYVENAKISVDTYDDLKEVHELMEKDTLRLRYQK
ncbi:MAG: 3-deoxy-manno-octulosonate cytidylyltransferase [Methanoregula sp.]|nr:3-deoxy-manno-octulosonate cytidylyltransferase [Methanoregula sp.]